MKHLRMLTERGRYLAAFLLILIVGVAFAMAQPGGETPAEVPAFPPFPPAVYFAMIVIGMVGHWTKGYTRGSITEGFWAYLSTNMGQTFGALIANIGALELLWRTSPGDMVPVTFFSIWSVLMTAYVGNSALNGTGPFIDQAAKAKAKADANASGT